MPDPRFDFWVCQGRLCRSQGADALPKAVATCLSLEDQKRVRVLRGGCYGLCELSANMVVRRWASDANLPDPSADRLNLLEDENEFVYCQVEVEDVSSVVESHVHQDRPFVPLTRDVRETATDASSPVAARLRALRQKKRSE